MAKPKVGPRYQPEDLLGTTINRRYRLQRVLQHGAAGTVYAAAPQEGADETWAVRILHWPDDETQPPFLPDLDSMEKVTHAHLLATLATGEIRVGAATGAMFLVADMATQGLNTLAPGVESAHAVAPALLDVLTFLHRKDLVHGRVQPGNVLFHKGSWKLADYGLVPRGPRHIVANASVKQALAWMDPALLAGHIGPECDVWGVGAVLLYLLTGRPPFTTSDPDPLLEQMLWEEPCLPTSLPAPFDLIVHGCLQRDIERRWSLQRVAHVLSDTLHIAVCTPDPETSAPPAAPSGYEARTTLALASRPTSLVLSPAGDVLITGTSTGDVSAWREGERLWQVAVPGPVQRLLWSPPLTVVIVCRHGKVHWVDAAHGQTRRMVESGWAVLEDAVLQPDGSVVLALGSSGMAVAPPGSKRAEGGKLARTTTRYTRRLMAEGGTVFSAGLDGTVARWNSDLTASDATTVLHRSVVSGIAPGPGGYCSGAHDGSLACWKGDGDHAETWRDVPEASIRCVAGSAVLAVAGHDDGTGTLLTAGGHSRVSLDIAPLLAVAVAAAAPVFAAACRRGTVTVWTGSVPAKRL